MKGEGTEEEEEVVGRVAEFGGEKSGKGVEAVVERAMGRRLRRGKRKRRRKRERQEKL